MAQVSYGGYKFSLDSAGGVIIDGGWRDGPIYMTYIEDLVPASLSSAASSPRVPESEKAAVIALGNNINEIRTLLR